MAKRSMLQQDESRCYFFDNRSEDDQQHPEDTYQALHKHHIFGGANRKHSEKYGLWVRICCIRCHNGGPLSIHEAPNKPGGKDLMLKQEAQRVFENTHSHEEFMRIFGKNYL